MPAGIIEELAELIGARLWACVQALGDDGIIKGVTYQAAPEYDPKSGRLLHGKQSHPMLSVTHVTPEQMPPEESTNVTATVRRTYTVAIIGDKKIVDPDPGPYGHLRTSLMNALHTYRGTGVITSVPNASIMHAIVKPTSPIVQAAWQNNAKFVSTFDVVFETEERPGLPQ